MKWILALLFLMILPGPLFAEQSGELMFVRFTTDHCHYCNVQVGALNAYKADFREELQRQRMKYYVADHSKSPHLSRLYRVRVFPTLLVVEKRSDGSLAIVRRHEGVQNHSQGRRAVAKEIIDFMRGK